MAAENASDTYRIRHPQRIHFNLGIPEVSLNPQAADGFMRAADMRSDIVVFARRLEKVDNIDRTDFHKVIFANQVYTLSIDTQAIDKRTGFKDRNTDEMV